MGVDEDSPRIAIYAIGCSFKTGLAKPLQSPVIHNVVRLALINRNDEERRLTLEPNLPPQRKRMKMIRSTSVCAILTLISAASLPQAFAAGGTWNLTGSGNWDVAENWDPVAVPGNAAGDIIGLNNDITSNTVVTSSGDRRIGILNMGDTSHTFGLEAVEGSLIFDNGSEAAQINVTDVDSKANLITGDIRITEGGLRIVNSATANGSTLNFGGTISSMADSGTQIISISNGAANGSSMGALISDGGLGGKVGVLIDTSALVIQGNAGNTYSGGTTIRRGTLGVTQGALGTGGVTLGDALAPGGSSARLQLRGSGSYANNIVTASEGGNNTLVIENGNVGSGHTNILTGTITINRTLTVTPAFGGTIRLQGAITGAGMLIASSNNSLNTLVLSGNNSGHTGGVRMGGPNLLVKLENNTALGTGAVTFGGGSSSQIANIQFDNTSGAAMSLAHNNNQIWSNFTFVGSDDLDMGTGNVTVSTAAAIANVRANKLTVRGVISGAGKSIGNTGNGTLELTGANTYTGATFVGGRLLVSQLADGAFASNIGASSSAAANLVLNRGTLDYTGAGAVTDRLFTIGNGGGAIASNGTGSLIFENVGDIVSTGAVAMTLAASATPSQESFGNGATIINVIPVGGGNSTAQLAVGQTIAGTNIDSGTVITEILDGGRIAISKPTIGKSTASLYTFGAIDRTLTLTGSNAGNNTIAGALSDAPENTLGLTKNGSGKWILSGVNTYTGVTTINEGTLLINGDSSNATGAVIVNGGVLGGSGGTIGGAVTINDGGTLAPGSSPGILTVDNNVTIANGGAFSAELNGPTVGTEYDRLVITGADSVFSLTGTNNLVLSLTFVPSDLIFLVDNQGGSAISGVFEQLNGVTTDLSQGAIFSLGAQMFQISYEGNLATNSFTGGNDLV
jgi:fibronectin-binding autotransporter adhesin